MAKDQVNFGDEGEDDEQEDGVDGGEDQPKAGGFCYGYDGENQAGEDEGQHEAGDEGEVPADAKDIHDKKRHPREHRYGDGDGAEEDGPDAGGWGVRHGGRRVLRAVIVGYALRGVVARASEARDAQAVEAF